MHKLAKLVCRLAIAAGVGSIADAQETVDMSKITCRQLLSMSSDAVEASVWLSGYYNGLRKNTRLDLGQLKHNSETVIAACRKDPRKTVMGIIDGLLPQGR
jgi:hypothetical protein